MSFLVDTNVVSELRKGAKGDPGVLRWFERTDEGDLFLSVVVLGELSQGVESIRRRDQRSARVLEKWLRTLVDSYGDRILSVDAVVAQRWGALNVPNRLPAVDGLMAATALVHGLTVVTRNTQDFEPTGVALLNPFDH